MDAAPTQARHRGGGDGLARLALFAPLHPFDTF